MRFFRLLHECDRADEGRRVPGLTLGLFVCLVGFVVGAGSPPADTPRWVAAPTQAADITLRDLDLVLQCRKALLQDEGLSVLMIGVSVRNGVARIWGTGPSRELVKRVEERLRQVPGLKSVQNDVHSQATERRQASSASLPLRPSPEPSSKGGWPGQDLQDGRWYPSGGGPANRSDMPVPSVSVKAVLSADRSGRSAGARPVESHVSGVASSVSSNQEEPQGEKPLLLPPLRVPSQASSLPTSERRTGRGEVAADPRELTALLETLRVSHHHYYGIRARVAGGIVTLGGSVNRWEHLYEYARAVSRMPGVVRVVLGDVRAESP